MSRERERTGSFRLLRLFRLAGVMSRFSGKELKLLMCALGVGFGVGCGCLSVPLR
jgi:hypothetical protein